MEKAISRIVIAGTNSGCGKTTVTCAILQALVNRGLKVGAFKCGPDYIDTMFHSRIIGAKSSNLDSFFFNENTARYLLYKNGSECDVNVIEGVMGFYDGLSLSGTKASTYELAQLTDSPVVLVINAKGASLSAVAILQGFVTLYPENHICGVVFNQCSSMTYNALVSAIKDCFGTRVRPLGYLPKISECTLDSRHLGLVTVSEISDLKEKMKLLSQQAEKTIDINSLLELSRATSPLNFEPIPIKKFHDSVRIAVAKDNAFCFHYEDSLDMLKEMGAELVSFSPLTDSKLPQGIHGIFLGGGYPELYAKQLSENTSMRSSILNAMEHKIPCIAECGGFMYLTQAIEGHPMVGFLKGNCYNTGKLTRFGYVTLKAKEDNMLCCKGDEITAHEFHHWDCEYTGNFFKAKKNSGKSWDCVFASEHMYAGYPHFHFFANPIFGERFYQACLKEKNRYD